MSRWGERKKILKSILAKSDWSNFQNWLEEQRNPDKVLFVVLYDPEPLIRWRAIVGLGKLAAKLSNKGDLESVRKIIRQVFWLMNDESGGLLWNGAEVIGMMLIKTPILIKEYGGLLANFIVEEPFEQGAHWALANLVKIEPDILFDDHVIKNLSNSLQDDNPVIRAYAFNILKEINRSLTEDFFEVFNKDQSEFEEYNAAMDRMEKIIVSQAISRGEGQKLSG